jgi:hypothetical protein
MHTAKQIVAINLELFHVFIQEDNKWQQNILIPEMKNMASS